jgi:hypothetical protein
MASSAKFWPHSLAPTQLLRRGFSSIGKWAFSDSPHRNSIVCGCTGRLHVWPMAGQTAANTASGAHAANGIFQ